ncbi:hypothetical protein MHYP_G00105430 [Metynnis hypsauchen]
MQNNESFSATKLQHFQTQLGNIIQSTLSLLAEVSNVTGAENAAAFSSLEDLSKWNINDLRFVESWAFLKLLPWLPYVTEEFLTGLSQINFTCEAYHIIVKGLDLVFEQMTLIRKQEITVVLVEYLKASGQVNGSGSPCGSSTDSAGAWLWANFGRYSVYVTLADLQSLNDYFSGVRLSKSFLVFPIIVKGLDLVFEQMTLIRKQEITVVLVEYLKASGQVNGSGSPCGSSTDSAGAWLWANFGRYSVYVTLADLQSLNDYFSGVRLSKSFLVFPIIVKGLDLVFEQMTLIRKQEITVVLVEYLKASGQVNGSGSPCGSSTDSAGAWLWANFGRYSVYVTLADLQSLNDYFSGVRLSKSFLVFPIIVKGLDLVFEQMTLIRKQEITVVLVEYLKASGQVNGSGSPCGSSTDSAGAWLWANFGRYSVYVTLADLQSLNDYFSGVRLSKSFLVFPIIVKGLDLVFEQMTLIRKQEITVVLVEYLKASGQVNGSGSPCGSSTDSAGAWLWANFGRYSVYVTLADLQSLNDYFSGVRLSKSFLVFPIIVKGLDLVFEQMTLIRKQEITVVLVEYLKASGQVNGSGSPCGSSTDSAGAWLWANFGRYSVYVTLADLQSLNDYFSGVRLSKSFLVFPIIVKGLDLVFEQMTLIRKQEITVVLVEYLKASGQVNGSGSPCGSSTDSAGAWLWANFGRYSVYVTLADLQSLNDYFSGVRLSKSFLVFPIIVKGLDLVFEQMTLIRKQEITVVLVEYLKASGQVNGSGSPCGSSTDSAGAWLWANFGRYSVYVTLADLQSLNDYFSGVRLSKSFLVFPIIVKGLDLVFEQMTLIRKQEITVVLVEYLKASGQVNGSGSPCGSSTDSAGAWLWANFGRYSVYVTLADLQSLNDYFSGVRLSKSFLVFPIIVKGLDLVFEQMTLIRKQEITVVLVEYLKASGQVNGSGSPCGSSTDSAGAWLWADFGRYSVYVTLADLQSLNDYFSGVRLSKSFLVFPIIVKGLDLVFEQMTLIRKQEITVVLVEYLKASGQVNGSGSPCGSSTDSAGAWLWANFGRYSVYVTLADLQSLNDYFSGVRLSKSFLVFPIIVKGLDLVFEQMTLIRKQEITVVLVEYLKASGQVNGSGSPCGSSTDSAGAWLWANFGRFSVYVTLADLQSLNDYFSGVRPSKSFLVFPIIVKGLDLVFEQMTLIRKQEITVVLVEYLKASGQVNGSGSPCGSSTDSAGAWLWANFGRYSVYVTLADLQSLNDYFSGVRLSKFFLVFPIIVKGLDLVFEQMTLIRKQEITVVLVEYLKASGQVNGSGSPCGSSTDSAGAWLWANFGRYSVYVTLADLQSLNDYFSGVRLSKSFLVFPIIVKGLDLVFEQMTLIRKQEITVVLVEYLKASGQVNGSGSPCGSSTDSAGAWLWADFGRYSVYVTLADLQSLNDYFSGVRLSKSFLVFPIIVKGLDLVFEQMTLIRKQEITVVLVEYLKASGQVNGSGSPCGSSTDSAGAWLWANFGRYSVYVTLADLQSLNDYFSGVRLSKSFLVFPIIVKGLDLVFEQMTLIRKQEITVVLVEYLKASGQVNGSGSPCGSSTDSAGAWLWANFGRFSVYVTLADLQSLNDYFSGVRPSKSFLVFPIIVKGLDLVFEQMTLIRKQEITVVLVEYLKASGQVNGSGSPCGSSTDSAGAWLWANFGRYSVYVTLADLQSLNDYFSGVRLSKSFLVFPIIVKGLDLVFEQMTLIRKQEITVVLVEYLKASGQVNGSGSPCGSSTDSAGAWLWANFGRYSVYVTLADLQSLNDYFSGVRLSKSFLVFPIIVKGLDLVFEQMTLIRKQEITVVLVEYLKASGQVNGSGSPCGSSTDSAGAWLWANFGRYSVYVTLADLQSLNDYFSGVRPSKSFLVFPIIVKGLDLVFEQMTLIRKQEITVVLVEYLKASGQVNGSGSPCGSSTDSAGAWLWANFGRYSVYVTLADLQSLNDYFSGVRLSKSFLVFPIIVKGLDLVFEQMTLIRKQEITVVLVEYLKASGQVNGSGSPCGSSTDSAGAWLWADFGRYSVYVTLADLQSLNDYFSGVRLSKSFLVFPIIVKGLDLVFEQMTLIRKQEITVVLVEYLKASGQVNGSGSPCGSSTDSAGAWLWANFGRYSVYVTLADLQSLNDYFSGVRLSKSFLVFPIIVKGLDLVFEQMTLIRKQEITVVLVEYLKASGQVNGSGSPCGSSTDSAGAWLWANFGRFSVYVTLADLQSLNDYFSGVRPSKSFLVFPIIVKGLDLVFEQMTLIRKQEITVVLVEYLKASGQVNGSGSPCGSSTDSAGAWLWANFGRYSVYVTLADLQSLNDYFSGVRLSKSFLVFPIIVKGLDLVFEQMTLIRKQEITVVLVEYLKASGQVNGSGSPCGSSTDSAGAWLWANFGRYSVYVTLADLQSLNDYFSGVRLSKSFLVFPIIVKGLDLVFEQMTLIRKQEITVVLVEYLKASGQVNGSGSPCGSSTDSAGAWLWANFGRYSVYVTLADLQSLNDYFSGVRLSKSFLVFPIIVKGLDLVFEQMTLIRKQEITVVLVEYLKASGQVNGSGSPCGSSTDSAGAWLWANFGRYSVYVTLADLQSLNDYFSGVRLSKSFLVFPIIVKGLDLVFEQMTLIRKQEITVVLVEYLKASGQVNGSGSPCGSSTDSAGAWLWANFGRYSIYVTLADLQSLNDYFSGVRLSKSFLLFPIIVKGLDLVFEQMTLIRKQEITVVLVEYLKASGQVNGSGSPCGSSTDSAGAWLWANFGRYSVYVTLADLQSLNDYFSGVRLSKSFLVFPIIVKGLDLVFEQMTLIRKQEITVVLVEYLKASGQVNGSGSPCGSSTDIAGAWLWANFGRYSVYVTLADLQSLNDYFSGVRLSKSFLVFPIIVKGLDLVFEQMTLIRKQEITVVLVEYLKASGQVNGSGSPCGSSTDSAGAWLWANFGRYSVYVTLADLQSLNDYFSGVRLSKSFLVFPIIVKGLDLVFEQMTLIRKQEITVVLVEYLKASGQVNGSGSPCGSSTDSAGAWLWANFGRYSVYVTLADLQSLNDYFSGVRLSKSFLVFPIIVKGLDLVFEQMTLIRKQEITVVLVEYLKASGQVNGSGSPCGSSTDSAGAWLWANFGRYSVYVTLADLQSLNDYFSGVRLSKSFLVFPIIVKGLDLVFEQMTLIRKQEITVVLVEYLKASGQVNGSGSPCGSSTDSAGAWLWANFGRYSVYVTLADLQSLNDYFSGVRLSKSFLVFPIIVKGLDLVFEQMTLIRKQEITVVLVEYLKASGQVNGSGSPCGSSTDSAGAWLWANFGRYSVYVTLADLQSLNDYFSGVRLSKSFLVFPIIVKGLDLVFEQMTLIRKQEITVVLVEYLKASGQVNGSGSPCGSSTDSAGAWLWANFGRYSVYVTLADLQSLNDYFSGVRLSKSFLVFPIIVKGLDLVFEQMTLIRKQEITVVLVEYLKASGQVNGSGSPCGSSTDSAGAWLWANFGRYSVYVTLADLQSLNDYFSGVRLSKSFLVFPIIVKGLDLVFEQMTLIRKQEITVVLVEYLKASGQVNGSGSPCGSSTDSAGAWLWANFGRYSVYVTLADLQSLNDYFSGVRLSKSFLVFPIIVKGLDLVFEQMTLIRKQEITVVLVEYLKASGQVNGSGSPCGSSTDSAGAWLWANFGRYSVYVTLADLQSLNNYFSGVRLSKSFLVFPIIVKGLDLVFEQMTLIRKQEITVVLVEYLKASGQVNGSGSPCGSSTDSAGAWLWANFGRYSVYVTLADLQSLNDYFSGVRLSKSFLVFPIIVKGLDLVFEQMTLIRKQEITVVLVEYLKASGQVNGSGSPCGSSTDSAGAWLWANFGRYSVYVTLADLQSLNDYFSGVRLSKSFLVFPIIVKGLDLVFEQMTLIRKQEITVVLVEYLKASGQVNGSGSPCGSSTDSAGAWLWANFGRYSVYVTLADLQSLNDYFSGVRLSKSFLVFPIIVKGLDLVFEQMTLIRKQEITVVLVEYLKASGQVNGSGSPCGSSTDSAGAWLWANFGRYSVYVTLADLQSLNDYFSGVRLSKSFLVFPIIVKGLDLVFEQMTLIRKQEITVVLVEYLKASGQVNGSGSPCGSSTDSAGAWLWANFGRYSVYVTLADLQSLNDYFSGVRLSKSFLVFPIIVKGLDLVFEQMTLIRKQEITVVLVEYLKASGQVNGSGSPCGSSTDSAGAWLWANFGRYSVYVTLADLQSLNDYFSGVRLSKSFLVFPIIVKGLDLVFEQMTLIRKQEITVVLVEYLKASGQVNGSGSPCGSSTDSAGAWLWANFGRYSVYVTLADLQSLNDYFSGVRLSKSFLVFPIIVKGLDLVFEQMTLIRKQEITVVLVEYLKASGQVNGSGSPCGSSTDSAGAWLWANFGRYSVYVTLADLQSLNDYFSGVRLSKSFLVFPIIVKGLDLVFEQMTLIRKQEITVVLVEYLKASGQVNGSGSPCGSSTDSAGAWLWANFGRYSVYVTLADLQSLNDYFSGVRLSKSFLVFPIIVKGLDLVFEQMTLIRKQEITVVLVEYLKASGQVNGSGSPCGSSTDSAGAWLWANFGRYSVYVTLADLQSLNDYFSGVRLSKSFLVFPIIVKGLDLVFEQMTLIRKQEITVVLVEYLKASGQVNGSGSPCGSSTDSAGAWLWANFGRYSVYVTLADLQSLNDYFSGVRLSKSFLVFPIIVKGLDLVFEQMTLIRKQEITVVLVEYLKASGQVNGSGSPCGSSTDSAGAWLWANFGRYSVYVTLADLQSLNDYFSGVRLSQYFLVFPIIVKGLDLVFEQMTLIRKQEITVVLVEYLKASGQVNGSGSPCGSSTDSAGAWLWANFGRYSVYVTLADLQSLNDYFSGVRLSKSFLVFPIIVKGLDLVFEQMTLIRKQEITVVLVEYLKASGQVNGSGSPCGSSTDSAGAWLWANFGRYSVYVTLADLQSLNDYFSGVRLSKSFLVFPIIVKGLDLVFEQMTLIRKQEITVVLVEYLKASGQVNGSGSPCGSSTDSAGAWLWANFGRYSVYVTLADLQSLNDYFSGVRLSKSFLVFPIIVKGLDLVFEQMTLIRKQEITVVLVAYLKGSGQVNGSVCFTLNNALRSEFYSYCSS